MASSRKSRYILSLYSSIADADIPEVSKGLLYGRSTVRLGRSCECSAAGSIVFDCESHEEGERHGHCKMGVQGWNGPKNGCAGTLHL